MMNGLHSFQIATILLAASIALVARAYQPPPLFSQFRLQEQRHRRRFVANFGSSLDDSFAEISSEFRDRTVSDIQQMLVQRGLDFQRNQENEPKHVASQISPLGNTLISPFEKVPGCVANVQVRTILKPNSKDGWDIHFEGTADALLSRGLLAVLTDTLSNSDSVEEILSVDTYCIADELNVRRALSPGRNDGLANMMKVIQRQIQSLLSNREEDGTTPLYVEKRETLRRPVNKVEQKVSQVDSAVPKEPSNRNKHAPKVALLLSGGVDSSVALRLLLQQNYDVTAFYLKIWLEDELSHLGQCPWEDDFNVCQQVCEQAEVPLETLSLQEEYRDRVISYTIHEAQRGRTPNPDILCNSRIKFGCFYDAIAERDFDFVASGHYARLESLGGEDESPGESGNAAKRLFRAPDPMKDQSYFLCALTQDQLRRVIFPIGHLEKPQVRELAEEFQLPNRHRADSQGLCFLGKVKFEEFLAAYLGERPGDIVDAATGDILGRHRGVWYHTVGQRKGIGKVLYPLATSRGPWYVVAKDPDRDLVFCSNQYDEEIFTAARSEVHIEDIKWVAGAPPLELRENGSLRFEMKIRHGPRLVGGTLSLAEQSGESGIVKLDQKDGGLAPGQFVVFYTGEECLGGGVISERHWTKFLGGEHMSTLSSKSNSSEVVAT